MDLLRHHPLGAPIPNSAHAVCCSLPTLRDVIGYEEKDPRVLEKLTLGYPRFVQHIYIRQLRALLAPRLGCEERALFLVVSEKAARAASDFCGVRHAPCQSVHDFVALQIPGPEEILARAAAFLQHTGCAISSRQAEEALLCEGLLSQRQAEETVDENPVAACRHALAEITGAVTPQDVILSRCGMNTFYAAFRAIQRVQAARGRDRWIQLGWLYVDTQRILEKFPAPERPLLRILDAGDLKGLRRLFEEHGPRIAGVITETPTNPLLQTTDVTALAELCRRHGAVCVLDPSSVSSANVDVLPLADVVVMSLTKYAGNRGDVMAGAAVLNPASPFAEELRASIEEFSEPLYPRDAARLAWSLRLMPEVVARGNANTVRLVEFLEKHPAVSRVHWSGSASFQRHYQRIARGPGHVGALLSIELRRSIAEFYDRLRVVKAPSFGVHFTMTCPFMYLAHYDLVREKKGRDFLQQQGINPDLLRLSVGAEPFDRIREVFTEALSGK